MATPILDDLSAGLLLYVILVVAIDYTIKGLAGFGSGLIAVPLRSPGSCR